MLRLIKERIGIILIMLLAFFLRLYMILVDPFLHEWDEKYHALVARNLMDNPFYPSIYRETLLPYDPAAWCCNQVWLHKQPLFLWQMALSMRLFGVSEWAMRLPSLLMGTASVWLVYRITWLLSRQKVAACIAAIIVACSCYQLNLISGREGMDHNDVAFNFYVLASFWAACEYVQCKTWKWALWIGFFSGCAVLNKWLTGLLVFLPLGILFLEDLFAARSERRSLSLLHFMGAIGTCVAVFLPWQLYIFHRFPQEAHIEFARNAEHIFSVVEGHQGGFSYYLDHFNQYFGDIIELLVIPAIGYFLWSRSIHKEHKYLLILPVLVIFTFFSFLVKTKVTGFFFVVYPLIIVMSGLLLDDLLSLIPKWRMQALLPLFPALAFWSLNPHKITDYTANQSYRQAKWENTQVYKQLGRLMPPGVRVLMNINSFDHADVMFYNPNIIAYQNIVSESEWQQLAARKEPIAVFEDWEAHILPAYVKQYPYLHIIHAKLRLR